MSEWLYKFLRPLFIVPYIGHYFFGPDSARDYRIGLYKKSKLLIEILRNAKRVPTLTSFLERLELAKGIFRIPPTTLGDVIECGCYKGGTTVILSLACNLVGRRLFVCDSFAGLPEPAEYDKAHYAIHTGHTDYYERGRFNATLEEVKGNVAKFGHLDSCSFVVGFFQDSLTKLDNNWIMAFLDVDLIDSLKPCIESIWPSLRNGCALYVHEAKNLSLVRLFFNSVWWSDHFNQESPGFVGAGTGLPLEIIRGSELGYARKGIAVR